MPGEPIFENGFGSYKSGYFPDDSKYKKDIDNRKYLHKYSTYCKI